MCRGESIWKHLKIRNFGYNLLFRNVYYSKNGIKSSRNSVMGQDIRFKFATTIDGAKILRNPFKKNCIWFVFTQQVTYTFVGIVRVYVQIERKRFQNTEILYSTTRKRSPH